MIRRFSTTASALSLLVCIGSVLLWVRSYRDHDNFLGNLPDKQGALRAEYSVASGRGSVGLWLGVLLEPVDIPLRRMRFESTVPSYDPAPKGMPVVFGFGYAKRSPVLVDWVSRMGDIAGSGRSLYGTTYLLVLPDYSIVLLSALLPAAWVTRRLRNRFRSIKGHCRCCGYDLRASIDRCPECGTTIPAEANA